jgi:hypothetical protein
MVAMTGMTGITHLTVSSVKVAAGGFGVALRAIGMVKLGWRGL